MSTSACEICEALDEVPRQAWQDAPKREDAPGARSKRAGSVRKTWTMIENVTTCSRPVVPGSKGQE